MTSTESGTASTSSTVNIGVSCCAAQPRVSLDDVTTSAAISHLTAQSFHELLWTQSSLRAPTCSHQGSNNNGLTNNTLLRDHDAILFSCSRANEFESGCEDAMNCACTVEVNCALPKDNRMTRNKISHAVQHNLGQMKCSSGLKL